MRSLDRARALMRSNFGRRDGWHVELDGARIGELDTPRWVEMFWCSYSLRCTADEHRLALQDDELWHRCGLVFRNRRTMEVAPRAFVGGGTPVVRDGRVLLRGLYLDPTSMLERVCLWVLELLRRRSDGSS